MTKENVLFSIIGVLFGFIVGFIFTNTVNQRALPTASRTGPAATTTLQPTENNLPPDHPTLPMNAVKEQQALESEMTEVARQAREAPDNFAAQMKAAELSTELKRYDDAIEFLLRANQLQPDNQQVVIALGNVNFDARRFENAEKWYTAALVKQPDNINVRTDLGLTFFLRNPPDADRAIAEFRESLKRNPEHELTLQNMTIALIEKKEWPEAQTMMDRLAKVNPNNPALSSLRSQIGSEGGKK